MVTGQSVIETMPIKSFEEKSAERGMANFARAQIDKLSIVYDKLKTFQDYDKLPENIKIDLYNVVSRGREQIKNCDTGTRNEFKEYLSKVREIIEKGGTTNHNYNTLIKGPLENYIEALK